MISSTLLLAATLLAPPPTPPQLLVVDPETETACRAAPEGWSADAPSDEATPAAVAEDLYRYFAGFSAQLTALLPAAWHGRIRFCSDAGETEVLGALALLVVQRRGLAATSDPDGLPIGAAELLGAFAGARLVEQLEALRPAGAGEAARRDLALQLVRERLRR